jgi:hypothetical protein
MTVMAREALTDERLEDLNKKVEGVDRRMETGFAEVRQEFRAVRGEMQAMRAELGAMRSDITHLTYGLIGAMLVGFLGTIVAIITQT